MALVSNHPFFGKSLAILVGQEAEYERQTWVMRNASVIGTVPLASKGVQTRPVLAM